MLGLMGVFQTRQSLRVRAHFLCVSANMYIKLESVRRHPRKSTYPVYSMNNSDNANRTVYTACGAARACARARARSRLTLIIHFWQRERQTRFTQVTKGGANTPLSTVNSLV